MVIPQTYVIGDIHGAYRALRQCLDRSNFNYSSDHLICLGDVADGWPETNLCIDELLKIEKLAYILGNHDIWLLNWMTSNIAEDIWLTQGGAATVASYSKGIPKAHVQFMKSALPYLVKDAMLFVHAGIDPAIPLSQQDILNFAWDRSLVQQAWQLYVNQIKTKLTTYDEVYVGHTPIPFDRPVQCCEIWMMDTGAGWSGVLSMMNINTKQVFTSDRVTSLYPGVKGRSKLR
jgi:serine/threonine protein phosphatase 1